MRAATRFAVVFLQAAAADLGQGAASGSELTGYGLHYLAESCGGRPGFEAYIELEP
jgi:hypothetical protein